MKHLHINHIRRLAATLLVALLVPIGAWAQTVAKPKFHYSRDYDLSGNIVFYNPVDLYFTCDTEGAEIYYELTSNGTDPVDPTAESTKYEGPIRLEVNTTSSWQNYRFKAIAIKDGVSSSVLFDWVQVYLSEVFLELNGTPAQYATNFKPGYLTMNCLTDDSEIYYEMTSDGSTPATPTTSSTRYTEPIYLDYNPDSFYQLKYFSRKDGINYTRSGSVKIMVKEDDPVLYIDNSQSIKTYYNPIKIKINKPTGASDVDLYYTLSYTETTDLHFDKENATLYTDEFEFWPTKELNPNVADGGIVVLDIAAYRGEQMVALRRTNLDFKVKGYVVLSQNSGYQTGSPFDLEVTTYTPYNEGAKLYYYSYDYPNGKNLNEVMEQEGSTFSQKIADGTLHPCAQGDKIPISKTCKMQFFIYDERIDKYYTYAFNYNSYVYFKVEADDFNFLVNGTAKTIADLTDTPVSYLCHGCRQLGAEQYVQICYRPLQSEYNYRRNRGAKGTGS